MREENISEIQEKNTDRFPEEKLELKYYNVRLHYFWIIFWLIFFALLFIVGVVFIVGQIELKIDQVKNSFSSSFIPNFLAGMIGIIFGFIFELFFIERLRRLKKFEGIRDCLIDELKSVGYICVKEWCNDKNIEKDINNEIYKKRDAEIKVFVLNDIVSNSDNQSIIYSLPRFFKWSLKGKLAEKLHNIVMKIVTINFNFQEDKHMVKDIHFADLLIYIKDFLLATDCRFKQDYKQYKLKDIECKKNEFLEGLSNSTTIEDKQKLITTTLKSCKELNFTICDTKFIVEVISENITRKKDRKFFLRYIKKQNKKIKIKRITTRQDMANQFNKRLYEFLNTDNPITITEVKSYFDFDRWN